MKVIKMLMAGMLLVATSAFANTINLQPHVVQSKYDFTKTVEVLTDALKSKGMTIFAKIDHQQAAKEVGLEMQPATVIIYGTPKAGTPLMVTDPTLALQLPLKVLVTETAENRVDVLFNTAEQVISHAKTEYSAVENSLAKAEKLIKATVSK